ncbi:MAG: cobalamin biosynthesis protein CbiA [Planctomycetota bacterium]|jgi:hypothetical protein
MNELRSSLDTGADGRLLMVVGNYGSGKTEVAVHLARRWARQGIAVSIADLDLVNPYFRCREARIPLEEAGVRVVVPPPHLEQSDLPIVLPEIAGMLRAAPGHCSIFDVGGDDVGSRVLASLHCALGTLPYELWQVINHSRPFTNTVGGCLKMQESIEAASRLKVTGLVANTHLMEHTDARVVYDGYELARDVAASSGLPLRCVVVPAALAHDPLLDTIEAPLLSIHRMLLPPWKSKGENLGSHSH